MGASDALLRKWETIMYDNSSKTKSSRTQDSSTLVPGMPILA